MRATLYQPGQQPIPVQTNGFTKQLDGSQITQNADLAAELLGCAPGLVDVLTCGSGYLVYSIFDYEGEANPEAMAVVAELSGTELNLLNEDEVLQGPVLVVVG